MPDINLTEVLTSLARHEEQIGQNKRGVKRAEEGVAECDKAMTDLQLLVARLEGTVNTRLKQIEWMLGLVVAALVGLAFAVLRKGVIP